MEDDDWEDNYDEWSAEVDDSDEEQTGPCPECGVDLHVDVEVCNACGYWLTTADRHKLWDGGSQVRQAMGFGKVVLVAFLVLAMTGLLILLR